MREYTGDMVCCRHALEHIPDTAAFMQTVRRAIGDKTNTVVFFELPDVERVLHECAFWDIYYEHCSYFSLGSLARLFRRAGLKSPIWQRNTTGNTCLIEARPANGNHSAPLKEEESVEELSKAVANFRATMTETVRRWKRKIESIRENGQRVRDLGFEFEVRGVSQYHWHPGRDRVHRRHQPIPPGQVSSGKRQTDRRAQFPEGVSPGRGHCDESDLFG